MMMMQRSLVRAAAAAPRSSTVTNVRHFRKSTSMCFLALSPSFSLYSTRRGAHSIYMTVTLFAGSGGLFLPLLLLFFLMVFALLPI